MPRISYSGALCRELYELLCLAPDYVWHGESPVRFSREFGVGPGEIFVDYAT
jgi:hypothetical protein